MGIKFYTRLYSCNVSLNIIVFAKTRPKLGDKFDRNQNYSISRLVFLHLAPSDLLLDHSDLLHGPSYLLLEHSELFLKPSDRLFVPSDLLLEPLDLLFDP